MSEFLLLGCFFANILILIIQLAMIGDLQNIRADLYYYSEMKDSDIDE